MMVVRPVRSEDINGVMDLIDHAGFGLTNLPKDQDLITDRIEQSVLAISPDLRLDREASYLFVMEDVESGRVVGTSGITSQVGIEEPSYAYRMETHVRESESLGVRKEVQCLYLVTISDGPCEIGALFIHPDYQGQGHGRPMSLSRFLFLAEHPERFSPVVIAEMRGVIDEQGRSPFWEAIGRPFFDMDFPKADYLTAKDKRFITELMPKHPIYVLLLPEKARAAIGQVHERTRPARNLLKQEGFVDSGMIDIFDGGNIVRCKREEIRTVKESKVRTYVGVGRPEERAKTWLLAKGRLSEFRACVAPVILEGDEGIRLASPAAEILQLSPGEKVRYAPLRPKKRKTA
jgi:arginine N-succinyltransferase